MFPVVDGRIMVCRGSGRYTKNERAKAKLDRGAAVVLTPEQKQAAEHAHEAARLADLKTAAEVARRVPNPSQVIKWQFSYRPKVLHDREWT